MGNQQEMVKTDEELQRQASMNEEVKLQPEAQTINMEPSQQQQQQQQPSTFLGKMKTGMTNQFQNIADLGGAMTKNIVHLGGAVTNTLKQGVTNITSLPSNLKDKMQLTGHSSVFIDLKAQKPISQQQQKESIFTDFKKQMCKQAVAEHNSELDIKESFVQSDASMMQIEEEDIAHLQSTIQTVNQITSLIQCFSGMHFKCSDPVLISFNIADAKTNVALHEYVQTLHNKNQLVKQQIADSIADQNKQNLQQFSKKKIKTQKYPYIEFASSSFTFDGISEIDSLRQKIQTEVKRIQDYKPITYTGPKINTETQKNIEQIKPEPDKDQKGKAPEETVDQKLANNKNKENLDHSDSTSKSFINLEDINKGRVKKEIPKPTINLQKDQKGPSNDKLLAVKQQTTTKTVGDINIKSVQKPNEGKPQQQKNIPESKPIKIMETIQLSKEILKKTVDDVQSKLKKESQDKQTLKTMEDFLSTIQNVPRKEPTTAMEGQQSLQLNKNDIVNIDQYQESSNKENVIYQKKQKKQNQSLTYSEIGSISVSSIKSEQKESIQELPQTSDILDIGLMLPSSNQKVTQLKKNFKKQPKIANIQKLITTEQEESEEEDDELGLKRQQTDKLYDLLTKITQQSNVQMPILKEDERIKRNRFTAELEMEYQPTLLEARTYKDYERQAIEEQLLIVGAPHPQIQPVLQHLIKPVEQLQMPSQSQSQQPIVKPIDNNLNVLNQIVELEPPHKDEKIIQAEQLEKHLTNLSQLLLGGGGGRDKPKQEILQPIKQDPEQSIAQSMKKIFQADKVIKKSKNQQLQNDVEELHQQILNNLDDNDRNQNEFSTQSENSEKNGNIDQYTIQQNETFKTQKDQYYNEGNTFDSEMAQIIKNIQHPNPYKFNGGNANQQNLLDNSYSQSKIIQKLIMKNQITNQKTKNKTKQIKVFEREFTPEPHADSQIISKYESPRAIHSQKMILNQVKRDQQQRNQHKNGNNQIIYRKQFVSYGECNKKKQAQESAMKKIVIGTAAHNLKCKWN